jgi:hypothetical protein
MVFGIGWCFKECEITFLSNVLSPLIGGSGSIDGEKFFVNGRKKYGDVTAELSVKHIKTSRQ